MANVHPFAKYANKAWPHRYHVELVVVDAHGGTPRSPDVVRSWLRAKAGWTDEMQIEAEVARIFASDPTRSDAEVADEATKGAADRHVNGFKRDEQGLYLEGRHLKACVKESCSVCRAADKLPAKFGATSKGTLSFVAEHIMVIEDRLPLGRLEHDDVHTRFVKTWRGTGITVEEVVYDVKVSATVVSDYLFTDEQWAMIWLTAEQIGLGSSRSQGFGKFTVTDWSKER
jgi:hypothetical protein